jgi:putative MATE family efflux protein
MKHTERIGKDSIGKLLLNFSVPSIIGMLVMASYNVVDRIFVGRGVGALALSGIAITFPLFIIVMGFGLLIGVGSTALVSLKLGEGKHEDAEKAAGNAFSLSIIISATLMIIGWIFLVPLLRLLGAQGEVFVYAKQYMQLIISGTIFQTIAFSMNSIIRGEGNPKIAMLTMIISAVLNAILNPIFIFLLHLGVRGSALSTIISQFIAAVWIMNYFFGRKSTLKLRLKNLVPNPEVIKRIFSIGVSPFVMQLASSVVIMIANRNLELYGGDLAIAALAIIYSVYMIIFMPVLGINQGLQPIVGYNYGASQYRRVLKALKLGMIAASAICVGGFILIMAFDRNIVMLFSTKEINLIHMTTHGLKIQLLTLPIIGITIITSSYFQAIGKPRFSIILTLLRQVVLIIPLLLILPKFLKLDGVWFATPISDGFTALLAIIFLFFEVRRLRGMQLQKAQSTISVIEVAQPEPVSE